MKSSIKDVAKKSGFSITTVSRALNGYADVNEATRATIKAAAVELNYVPNTIARSLVMQKSKTIALLIANTQNHNRKDNFTYEVLYGVLDRSSSLGYECIVVSIDSQENRKKTFDQICQERMIDGVIIQGIDCNDPIIEQAKASMIKSVFIDLPVIAKNIGYVSSTQSRSIEEVVDYLVDNHHQKMAFVTGSKAAVVSEVREMGYAKGLGKHRLLKSKEHIIQGDFREDTAYHETYQFLKQHPEVTAFVCASDVMAIGVMKAIREHGYEVGIDISVVGFDNIPLTEYLSPPLTTVAQDSYEIGRQSVELLIDLTENKEVAKYRLVKNELIFRSSVGECKKS